MYKEIKCNLEQSYVSPLYRRGLTGSLEGGGCIMGYRDGYKKYDQHFLIAEKKTFTTYPIEDVEEYVKFLNNAGFKIQFSQDDNYLIFTFERDDYPTWPSFLAAFTAMRYIMYRFLKDFLLIPQYAIEIKNKLGDKIHEFEALQLAHYRACSGLYTVDSLHGLFGTVSKIVTREEYETKRVEGKVNEGFYKKGDVAYSWTQVHNKVKENEEEALNMLR